MLCVALFLIKILIYSTNFKTLSLPTAGVVRSVKETLNSQFVDNCKGVIERLTLKEEKMVWNRTTHLWYVFVQCILSHKHTH